MEQLLSRLASTHEGTLVGHIFDYMRTHGGGMADIKNKDYLIPKQVSREAVMLYKLFEQAVDNYIHRAEESDTCYMYARYNADKGGNNLMTAKVAYATQEAKEEALDILIEEMK